MVLHPGDAQGNVCDRGLAVCDCGVGVQLRRAIGKMRISTGPVFHCAMRDSSPGPVALARQFGIQQQEGRLGLCADTAGRHGRGLQLLVQPILMHMCA